MNPDNMQCTKLIFISAANQEMLCYEQNKLIANYPVSTGKNGLGELINSERTPRGWHRVYSVIGTELPVNSVLVSRKWTGEIYSKTLAKQFPSRDWILTRIIQLDGLEPGRNRGGDVDTLKRYIYIHGTPDTTELGVPGSHGCIRMNNQDVINISEWVSTDTLVYIE
ncbi:L,D-transpeptidase [Legionella waltersii]|uniref:Putative ErfK/YbiS/YcfS/YnhG protein n=2 Tax=Legionella waltersii TaxID=66969 RepID=A0A0W1A0Y6_9GAMM|nr:L,D-transpeptidase [Legionella waltersii]KTD75020.1 putative ErfK/YbiS/YcfS/YnhG protein [Legionella waltersii]SNV05517.1 putative ErfK/YbiS/YcfS/YnhG protein [Legionella waltersii]